MLSKAALCVSISAPVIFVLQGCGGDGTTTHAPAPSPTPVPVPTTTVTTTSGSTEKISYVGDIESLGCMPETEEQAWRHPSYNFSLEYDYAERNDTLAIVACIVQGYDQVASLLPEHLPDDVWSTAPLTEKCIAIGSSCGTPCNLREASRHSDWCDTTGMTILPAYLYNENALKNHTPGQGFSPRYDVRIGNRKNDSEYPLGSCEPCYLECEDCCWESHCREGGKSEEGLTCEDWKCKDPEDDDDEPVPASECRERFECESVRPVGLNVKNLYVQVKFDEDDIPPAIDGALYSVILVGRNLQRSSGMEQPSGSWQVIYAPLETEPMQVLNHTTTLAPESQSSHDGDFALSV